MSTKSSLMGQIPLITKLDKGVLIENVDSVDFLSTKKCFCRWQKNKASHSKKKKICDGKKKNRKDKGW